MDSYKSLWAAQRCAIRSCNKERDEWIGPYRVDYKSNFCKEHRGSYKCIQCKIDEQYVENDYDGWIDIKSYCKKCAETIKKEEEEERRKDEERRRKERKLDIIKTICVNKNCDIFIETFEEPLLEELTICKFYDDLSYNYDGFFLIDYIKDSHKRIKELEKKVEELEKNNNLKR